MSENKRRIKQIGPHSFLFNNNPGIFYFLSFEIIDLINIQIYLIKIMPTETYVFETIIPFNKLGTDDPTPQDTIQNILFIIHKFDFIIKEESNKTILSINSKNKASIELLIYSREKKVMKKALYKGKINNMEKRILELLSTIVKQDKRINELRKKEQNHRNILNKLGQITNALAKKINKPDNNNSSKYNERNSLKPNYNRNQNNNNKNNKNLLLTKSMTVESFNPFLKDINLTYDNINSKTIIKKDAKKGYNPYDPKNFGTNNLNPTQNRNNTIHINKFKNFKP